ncbi:MAG: hypothetical protein Tsb0017_02410 [Geothermobacteraceae bacterium]
MSRKPFVVTLSLLLVLAAAVLAWLVFPRGIDPARAALAEYRVDKLSCGSCVQKINDVLVQLDGIGAVEVDLASGRCRVEYDPGQTDATAIAETISAAGYPARVRTKLSPDEYADLRGEQQRLAQRFVARVGDRLLTREEFDRAMRLRLADREATPQLIDQLRRQLWNDLRQRELLLFAAGQAGVIVQPAEIDARIEQLRQGHADLEQLVAKRFGDWQDFHDQLRADMTIERLVQDKVLTGINDPARQQQKLNQWYQQLQQDTQVVIFDPQLKQSAGRGGDCSSGCCG